MVCLANLVMMIIGGQRPGGRAAPANLGNLGNLGTGVSDFSCQSWPTTPKFPAQTCLKTTTNNADETMLKCYKYDHFRRFSLFGGFFHVEVCGEFFVRFTGSGNSCYTWPSCQSKTT